MLRQKYIGETKHYEVDELFISKIRDMPKPIGLDIAMQIDEVASDLPVLDFWQQMLQEYRILTQTHSFVE